MFKYLSNILERIKVAAKSIENNSLKKAVSYFEIKNETAPPPPLPLPLSPTKEVNIKSKEDDSYHPPLINILSVNDDGSINSETSKIKNTSTALSSEDWKSVSLVISELLKSFGYSEVPEQKINNIVSKLKETENLPASDKGLIVTNPEKFSHEFDGEPIEAMPIYIRDTPFPSQSLLNHFLSDEELSKFYKITYFWFAAKTILEQSNPHKLTHNKLILSPKNIDALLADIKKSLPGNQGDHLTDEIKSIALSSFENNEKYNSDHFTRNRSKKLREFLSKNAETMQKLLNQVRVSIANVSIARMLEDKVLLENAKKDFEQSSNECKSIFDSMFKEKILLMS